MTSSPGDAHCLDAHVSAAPIRERAHWACTPFRGEKKREGGHFSTFADLHILAHNRHLSFTSPPPLCYPMDTHTHTHRGPPSPVWPYQVCVSVVSSSKRPARLNRRPASAIARSRHQITPHTPGFGPHVVFPNPLVAPAPPVCRICLYFLCLSSFAFHICDPSPLLLTSFPNSHFPRPHYFHFIVRAPPPPPPPPHTHTDTSVIFTLPLCLSVLSALRLKGHVRVVCRLNKRRAISDEIWRPVPLGGRERAHEHGLARAHANSFLSFLLIQTAPPPVLVGGSF